MSNVTKKIFVLNAQPGGNKGAEAMLETVLNFLTENFKNYKIFVESLNDSPAYEVFKNRTKFDVEFIRFSPKNILSPYEVTVSDTDIAIDIGGINYHDKSIKANVRNYIRHSFFSRKRAKLIFFTQDFGPCEKLTTKIFAKLIYRKAEAIFMRSEKSRALLEKTIKSNHIYGPYPDCTFLLSKKDSFDSVSTDYFVISLSAIMYNSYGDEYVKKIYSSLKCISQNLKPVILVHNFTHNGDCTDEYVNKMLYERFKKDNIDCDFFSNEVSPSQLKSILEKAKFSITSRYHVVVGSLSSGVPSIAIGWSHKYQEFLNLYNLKELNLDYSTDLELSIKKSIENIHMNDDMYRDIKDKNIELKNSVQNSFEHLKKIII